MMFTEPRLQASVACDELALDTDVRAALAWLDMLLGQALACAHAARDPEAGTDPFRGLHISPAEVVRLLRQRPGEPLLASRELATHADDVPRPSALEPLIRTYSLKAFDIALLLIAAAPELDLRYERLFAYLQDDVNRKRPTVDLALNLLCGSLADKLSRRSHFTCNAPLLQHRLLHLQGEGAAPGPLLTQVLRLDEQVLDLLLGQASLDRRLASCCRLLGFDELSAEAGSGASWVRGLQNQARQYVEAGKPLGLFLQGPPAADLDGVARTLALGAGLALLEVDLARLPTALQDAETALALLPREAWLKDAALHLRHFDVLQGAEHARSRDALARHVAGMRGLCMLSGTLGCDPLQGAGCHLVPVRCEAPTAAQRTATWTHTLCARGMGGQFAASTLAALGEGFQLGHAQIEGAVAHAVFLSRGRGDAPSSDDLFLAARQQTRHVLARLAVRVDSTRGWGDLVLADDALAQLREICAQFVHRHRVMEDWGFGRKLPYGKGLNVLFAGPSGTGKTMAAEVVANELKLDLYKIDLARVVSKYIGETEQNLDRIFTAAQDANAILFFDEADALFGKRSEVKDAHDRYANLEISYLLQKMEQYGGVTILASNLRQNIDEAFVRRLGFIVQFAFPDEAQRQRIWSAVWPEEAPRHSDIGLHELAAGLKLSGGAIRNVALGAAFLAAQQASVDRACMLRAARREYAKTGQNFPLDANEPSGAA